MSNELREIGFGDWIKMWRWGIDLRVWRPLDLNVRRRGARGMGNRLGEVTGSIISNLRLTSTPPMLDVWPRIRCPPKDLQDDPNLGQ